MQILPFYGVAADIEEDSLLQGKGKSDGQKRGELVGELVKTCFAIVCPGHNFVYVYVEL